MYNFNRYPTPVGRTAAQLEIEGGFEGGFEGGHSLCTVNCCPAGFEGGFEGDQPGTRIIGRARMLSYETGSGRVKGGPVIRVKQAREGLIILFFYLREITLL